MATRVYVVDSVSLSLLKSNPPKLIITASGTVNSTGWTQPRLRPRFNIHFPPANGIYEFDFVADPPTGPVLWVMTSVKAGYIMDPMPGNLKAVIVHSCTNSIEEPLMQTQPEPVLPPVRTATGYSNHFHFDEAFQDAVNNLPPLEAPYPDYMEIIKVVETGAMIGGIAGLHRMYVKIEAR
jgi:hypothetical protein